MDSTTDVGRFQGTHVLGELAADGSILDDLNLLAGALERALTEGGATVLQVVGEKFEPYGVTVVAVLAESHASLHTYPEHEVAFFDLFTCGETADPVAALRLLVSHLDARVTTTETIARGRPRPSAPTARRDVRHEVIYDGSGTRR